MVFAILCNPADEDWTEVEDITGFDVLLTAFGRNDNDDEEVVTVTVSECEVAPRPAMIYAPIPVTVDVIDEVGELALVEEPGVVEIGDIPSVKVKPRPAITYPATPFELLMLIVAGESVAERDGG